MSVVPDPMKFGTGPNTVAAGDDIRFGRLGGLAPAPNKGLYYDAAGAPQLEDYIRDGTFNIGVSCSILGDLTVAFASQACTFDKRGKMVDIYGAPSFTLTYTALAWAVNTPFALGVRRIANAGVYEVTGAGTSATTGTGPTGTGTAITDGSVTWKYVSVPTSGQFSFTGLPFAADAGPRQFLNMSPGAGALVLANNGTAALMSPSPGLTTAAIFATKSANAAQSAQVSTGQFNTGVLYTLPFSGRYKAAA